MPWPDAPMLWLSDTIATRSCDLCHGQTCLCRASASFGLSAQERLADTQTEATRADSEAKAADVRAKHLAKQLAEQQKVGLLPR